MVHKQTKTEEPQPSPANSSHTGKQTRFGVHILENKSKSLFFFLRRKIILCIYIFISFSSIALSGLDLPDVTVSIDPSFNKGLCRKRTRLSLNVTAFEKRLKGAEGEFEDIVSQ